MAYNYEGIIVLDTRGYEGSVEDFSNEVAEVMKNEGAEVKSVEDLGRKEFSYNSRKLAGGFYVRYEFSGEAEIVSKVKEVLKIKEGVYLQHYKRLA